ncbi:MAG: hypothetical protein MRZ79_24855 [Bacteroidia bacterium]|nr:hypothetical protein [Bacteroidia bacterium]
MSKTLYLKSGLLMLALSFIFFSCSSNADDDISGIEVKLDFVRVDSLMWAYANAYAEDSNMNLYEGFDKYLGSEEEFFYEFLNIDQVKRIRRLSDELADSVLKAQMASLLKEEAMLRLLDTVRKEFPYDMDLVSQLEDPLKRLNKHFPEIQLPKFRTFANGYMPGGDMRSVDNVVPIPNYFGFGLHYFLGKNYPYYPENVPAYERRYFKKEYMAFAMAREITEGMVAQLPRNQSPNLISGMIREGIKQYFLERLLPETADSVRLRYTASQMEWANIYEARIYKELVDKFFESDFKIQREYLGEKPFTSSLSKESAPRIGEYCGWKIVKSYMKRHPEVSLAELTEMQDYEKILREARYKPEG